MRTALYCLVEAIAQQRHRAAQRRALSGTHIQLPLLTLGPLPRFSNSPLFKLPAAAINNSWGGGGYSSALYAAIERAKAADILIIVAAGNAGAHVSLNPVN